MPARAGDDEACGGEGLGEYCGCEGVAPGAGEKRELDGLRRGHPLSYQSRTPRMVNCTGRHVLLTYKRANTLVCDQDGSSCRISASMSASFTYVVSIGIKTYTSRCAV